MLQNERVVINRAVTLAHPHLPKLTHTHPYPAGKRPFLPTPNQKKSHPPKSNQKKVQKPTSTHIQPKNGHTQPKKFIPSHA